jgi:hypothetical protein
VLTLKEETPDPVDPLDRALKLTRLFDLGSDYQDSKQKSAEHALSC